MKLPPSASVANPSEGAMLHAPAAVRNADVLTALIAAHAPETGDALEIASGTGQHVVRFAAQCPELRWHPTEVDPARRASIDAYAAQSGLPNLTPASALDACAPSWSQNMGGKDLIVVINLLHLISTPQAKTLIVEAAYALSPNGVLVLYGPFKRAGSLTSAGDQRFDAELRGADPLIGYKDDLDFLRWLHDAGLTDVESVDMPANNLAFIARKPE